MSLLGLLGEPATQSMITELAKSAPANVRRKILLSALSHSQQDHAAAGILARSGRPSRSGSA